MGPFCSVCLHLNYFCLQQPYFQIMSPSSTEGLVLRKYEFCGDIIPHATGKLTFGKPFQQRQIIDKTAELERWDSEVEGKQKSVGQTEIDGPQGQMKCLCWGQSKRDVWAVACVTLKCRGWTFHLPPSAWPHTLFVSPELYGKLVYFSSLLMKRIITEKESR